MKTHQLNAFLAAVETGSIRAAARKLFLSQSALTKALRELEQDLETPLIHRSVRGITLTEGGTRLLARARLIAQQILLARTELKQMQDADEGSVSIGVSPLVALTVFPQAVAAFRRRYRNVMLHVVGGLEGIILPGVRQGSLDFGIMVTGSDSLGEDLAIEPWFSAPNAVVLREGHPKAQARTLPELADQEWLVTSYGAHGLGSRMFGFFKDAGLQPPEHVLRCESVITALAIVRNSDVITFMPKGLLDCPETQGIRAAPLRQPPPRSDFGMVMRVDVPLTPVAEAFVKILRDLTLQKFGPPRGARARA